MCAHSYYRRYILRTVLQLLLQGTFLEDLFLMEHPVTVGQLYDTRNTGASIYLLFTGSEE